MLGHPSTGGVLGVDLTEPCLDANRDQKLVTAAMPGVEPSTALGIRIFWNPLIQPHKLETIYTSASPYF